MNWQVLYTRKRTDVRTAIAQIAPGERIALGHAAATPLVMAQGLATYVDMLANNQIFHMLTLGDGAYMQPGMEQHIRHITNFVAGNSRQAIDEGRADFFPAFFYEVPHLMRSGLLSIDVAIIQVSPPNEEGYCSFGLSCDYTQPATTQARIVIAEVNKQLPFIAGGNNLIHIEDIDYLIEVDYPPATIPQAKIGEVERSIGQNCASLVQDGDTLQLGIGAIPDAVLLFLQDKKDLGIHTEMFSDGAMALAKAGVITGKKKSLHPGKMVATFLMGTEELYKFVDQNDAVELYPVDYVNDPNVIAQNDNLISINSAIEVDLMGQIASETMGERQYSGTGGQVDYVRGASRSKGGKSIIALPATARKGAASRIVAHLTPGGAVTTSRNEVDYIVTEYGIAHLKGKTLRERAQALIAIAHPDYRDALWTAYYERFGK